MRKIEWYYRVLVDAHDLCQRIISGEENQFGRNDLLNEDIGNLIEETTSFSVHEVSENELMPFI
jgi:hypothetical protein